MPYFLQQITDDKTESWSSVSDWKCSLKKLGSDPFLMVQPPDMFLPICGISELNWICQSGFGRADGGLRLVTVQARWEYSPTTPTLSHVTGMCVMALYAVELAAVCGRREICSTFPPSPPLKSFQVQLAQRLSHEATVKQNQILHWLLCWPSAERLIKHVKCLSRWRLKIYYLMDGMNMRIAAKVRSGGQGLQMQLK